MVSQSAEGESRQRRPDHEDEGLHQLSSIGARDQGLGRLLKTAHLLRSLHSSSLRRTSMYASLFGISGVLHLAVFEQPAKQVFFGNLAVVMPSPQEEHS
jgi:hypothetical protein